MSQITQNFGTAVPTTFVTDAGNAVPVLNTLTILGGAGITTSAAGSTITITAAPTELWTEIVAVSANMAVNSGYIANNVGLVTLTLPAIAAVGSMVRIKGSGAGGVLIAQNAGQQIVWTSLSASTVGVAGSISSTDRYDFVDLICIAANTTWSPCAVKGNWTVT